MSTEPNSPTQSNSASRKSITRRRTGCIPCRDRHVRCDERQPLCRRCERASLECFWTRGVKIVFHDPNRPAKRRASNTGKSPIPYQDAATWASNSTMSLPSPGLENVRPVSADYEPLQEQFTDWAALEASDLIQEAFRTDIEIKLMHNYLTEVAPWFDAHSGSQFYSRLEVPRMLACPPWRAAAMAISAKNIELRERRSIMPGSDSLPLHLYQLAVRLAIDAMSGRYETVGALAGCVLLCVYEMMTVTYTDWRRHVAGCTSIYAHNNWNGSTGGLISGTFWDYARIDIWAAFCAQTRTMMPTGDWFDDPESILRRTDMDEELHSQVAIWLTAIVVNLVSNEPSSCSPEDVHALRSTMESWPALGGPSTHPVLSREADAAADHPFPRIMFSTHSSIIGHTMWNSAMVLLSEHEVVQRPQEAGRLREEAYNHALAAAGIIETNNHTACLVNSLQPAFICGRQMRTKGEKFAILELLAQIEKKTGWKCQWRLDGLREIWNLC